MHREDRERKPLLILEKEDGDTGWCASTFKNPRFLLTFGIGLAIVMLVTTVVLLLMVEAEKAVDGLFFGIAQTPKDYQTAHCSYFTLDPKKENLKEYREMVEECPPANTQPWTYTAQNGSTLYYIWLRYDDPHFKTLYALDTTTRNILYNHKLETNDNVGFLSYAEPHLYIGWSPNHRNRHNRLRRLDTRDWTEEHFPPINATYPLAVKDEYIAYAIDFSDSYSIRLNTYFVQKGNLSSTINLEIPSMDWYFQRIKPNNLIALFWCHYTDRLYGLFEFTPKKGLSDTISLLEINPEIGSGIFLRNFTLFDNVAVSDVVIQYSYNPNEHLIAFSAEYSGENQVSYFVYDIKTGEVIRTDMPNRNYPLVMALGYFGTFW